MAYRHNHRKQKIKNLRPKKRFFQKRWFWITCLSAAAVGIIIYLLLFIPGVQIEQIQISGNQAVSGDAIGAVSWAVVNKPLFSLGIVKAVSKSIITQQSASIANAIRNQFPQIQQAVVQKSWPHTLKVTVTERQAVAVFCRQNQPCFYIDANGVIFKDAATSSDGMMVMQDENSQPMALGQNVVDQKTMDAVIAVAGNLTHTFQLQTARVTLGNPLVVTVTEGWEVDFDPAGDVATQIARLDSLLQTQITPTERKNLHYIYLQYQDRAYYK